MQKNLLRGTAAAGLISMALAMPAVAQNAQFTPDSSAPIQLHMPVQLHMPAQAKPRRKAAKKTAPAEAPAAADAAPIGYGSAAPGPAAPPPHKAAAAQHLTAQPPKGFAESRSARRKAVQEVLSSPASATPSSDAAVDVSGPAAIPFTFDSASPPPPRQKSSAASTKSKAVAAARAHSEVAALETPPPKTSAEPPAPPKPKGDPHAGMSKKGEVLFAGQDIEPQSDSADALKAMAGDLNTAIDTGTTRIELEAFGGAPGEKSSDSRRLALRRALAIRQILIDKGIPATRIDVKAMGGVEDHGSADRVDVWLRGG